MSGSKPQKIIKISSSSIVDLKAELSRKEEQIRLQKIAKVDNKNTNQNDDVIYKSYLEKKTKLPKRILDSLQQAENETKNKKAKPSFVKDKAKKDSELNENEERILKQSRECLERKAELYSQMSKGLVNFDPDDENILVNFEEKSERFQNDESKDEKIEYVDQFGRTRMLTKSEIEEIELEKEKEGIEKTKEIEDENSNSELYEPKAPTILHYQDVRENEVREHGVAFYSFSTDEETRSKQMKVLEQLRKETEIKKLQKQKIIDKRKQMLKSRLEKIALRKGIKLPEEPEEKIEDPSEMIRIEKATIMPELKRTTTGTKEWDIGKEGVFSSRPFNQSPFYSQEKYQEKLRNERNPEFAPPRTYQTNAKNKFDKKQSTRLDNKNNDEYSFIMNEISEIRKKS